MEYFYLTSNVILGRNFSELTLNLYNRHIEVHCYRRGEPERERERERGREGKEEAKGGEEGAGLSVANWRRIRMVFPIFSVTYMC